MRLKRIAQVCAKLKRIVLCGVCHDDEENGFQCEQWIGDGAALYPANELPGLNDENVFTVFDIPPETRKKWIVVTHMASDLHISFKDDDPSDRPLDEFGVSVEYGGVTFKPFKTEDGKPLFINELYLRPIAHLLDEITFFERDAGFETEGPDKEAKKVSAVVAKTGMMISAIIMPKDPTKDEGFLEGLFSLAETCRAQSGKGKS